MGGAWSRRLEVYPARGRQAGCLIAAMVTAVMLAWLSYVAGGVAPQIMAEYGMSFRYYVAVAIAAIAVGALGALAAGLADRCGRVPIVVGGMLASSLLVLFALPAAGGKTAYILLTALTGVAEGAAGVALPAIVRDFSAQVRRATAMALWSLGPILGSLIVTGAARMTLDAHPDWRFQFRLCGVVGLVVAAAGAVLLRELSPALRNQVTVRSRDRELAELRAARPDRPATRGSVVGANVIGSAFAISLYLIFYYVLVGFFVIYLVTTFGYSGSRANGLATWYWAAAALATIGAGLASDRLNVRKPLMVAGALVSAVASLLMAATSREASPSYGLFVGVVVLAAAGNGLVFAPWMAAFTETVERRNPAAAATGLATWSLVNKVVVTAVLVAFTFGVTAPGVLVDKGARVHVLAEEHPAAVAALAAGQPLPAGDRVPAADLEFLRANLADVARAKHDGPRQWQQWWWVCALAQLAFVPFVGLLTGRWRPRTARADLRAHDAEVVAALTALRPGVATG